MTPLRTASIGAIALLSIAGSFAFAMSRQAGLPASPDVTHAAEAPPAASVFAPTVPEEDFLGIVLARTTADIAPRFDGRLLDVHVRLGDRVAAGAPIATLDVPSLKFDLRVAEANLQAAGAEQKRTSVELAESEERLKRRKALSAEALVTGEDLSATDYQQKLAQARMQATHAQLAERRAQVDKLRQDNADTVIRAPFAGIIAARYADPGSNVSPSAPIVRLISADDLFVRFAVPEDRAAHVQIGNKVTVRIGERRSELPGTIEKVAPEVDAASRMVFVEAQLEKVDPKTQVLSGGLTRVSIDGAR
jgi:RND family efflux transporter MFP subunit